MESVFPYSMAIFLSATTPNISPSSPPLPPSPSFPNLTFQAPAWFQVMRLKWSGEDVHFRFPAPISGSEIEKKKKQIVREGEGRIQCRWRLICRPSPSPPPLYLILVSLFQFGPADPIGKGRNGTNLASQMRNVRSSPHSLANSTNTHFVCLLWSRIGVKKNWCVCVCVFVLLVVLLRLRNSITKWGMRSMHSLDNDLFGDENEIREER